MVEKYKYTQIYNRKRKIICFMCSDKNHILFLEEQKNVFVSGGGMFWRGYFSKEILVTRIAFLIEQSYNKQSHDIHTISWLQLYQEALLSLSTLAAVLLTNNSQNNDCKIAKQNTASLNLWLEKLALFACSILSSNPVAWFMYLWSLVFHSS